MRSLTRRNLLLAATLGLVVAEQPAYADLFGGDLPLLTGILAQAITEVSDLGATLQNIQTQVTLMKTELSRLDPTSFATVLNLINDVTYSYSNVVSGVSSIGYTLQAVNASFQSTFPSNLTGVPLSQFGTLYARWQTEILASARVASRAQSVISDWQDNARNAAAILAESRGAQGAIGELQSVVQMLGVLHNENNSLLQTLATTGRVLSDASAASASERQLSLEKKRRNLANYTFRGAPVPVPKRMP
jgi:P-type conjugative transfer protein TrbJ